ncbi:MAG: hypothetical protein LZF60_230100 [Nitrospira sp.]|nr:MAG: hypothetical protein LZF60_230100 [Nitrospira sp.]
MANVRESEHGLGSQKSRMTSEDCTLSKGKSDERSVEHLTYSTPTRIVPLAYRYARFDCVAKPGA